MRDVVTAANFVVDCKAVSNTTVYLMDYNGNSDSWTEVKKAVFSGSSWSVTDSFDATTLGAGNSRYALVVHSNGKLYLPPQNPETGLVTRQMMSCSQSNLSGTCASVGDDISADTVIPSSGDCSTPQGAVEIPGTNELLVMSNLCATGGALLMRYDLTTGVYTPLTSSSGVLPSNFSGNGVRFMRIR